MASKIKKFRIILVLCLVLIVLVSLANLCLAATVSPLKNNAAEINKQVKALSSEVKKAERKLKKIPENPKKKKFKHGPIDYSISIINLANNINSKLIEIATKGKEKYQLSTLLGSFYSISAQVSEDENNIYVEYFNMRQQKQINMVQNLCDYFNPKNIKLKEKTLKFTIKT